MAKFIQKVWIWRWVALMLPVMSLAACGEDTQSRDAKAVAALKAYYKASALPRNWVVDEVRVSEESKLMVEVVVESPDDVMQIKSRSRMLQFFIAKQGCPKPEDDDLQMVEKNYRVWVRLWSPSSEELTNSICPRLYGE